MNVRSNLKTLLAALTVALAFVVLLTSCGGSGAIKEPLNSEELSRSGNLSESGDAPDGDSSADSHDDDETPEPPKTTYCFYIKDAQLYFVDSISKTPIRLTDDLNKNAVHDNDYYKNYVNTLSCKYFEQEHFVLFRDSNSYRLYFKDVSDPGNKTVHLADKVSAYSFAAEESAVYFTTFTGTENGQLVGQQRHRFDIKTGETVSVESAGDSDDPERTDNGNSAQTDNKFVIREYDTGEKYYRDKTDADGLVYFYSDGEHDALPLISSLESYSYLETQTASKQPVMVIRSLGKIDQLLPAAFIKGKRFTIDFSRFFGFSIHNMKLLSDGKRLLLVMFNGNSADNGLYSVEISEDKNGTIELIASDIAKHSGDYGVNFLWFDSKENFYFLTKSALLCCNSRENVVDYSTNNHIFGFYNDELLYAAGQDAYYTNRPYTLKSADVNGSRVVADSVLNITYKRGDNTGAFWMLKNYNDDTCLGTLCLYEEGILTEVDDSVIQIVN